MQDCQPTNQVPARLRRETGQLTGYGLGGHKAKINAFGYLKCGYMRRPFLSVPKQNEEKLAEYIHSKYADMIRG